MRYELALLKRLLKHLVVKFWWVIVLALAVAVQASASGIGGSSGVGGMPGAPVFSGTVSSTKACAAGYTRRGPNYCSSNSDTAVVATRDICISVGAVPADAKGVRVLAAARANAANAILARFTLMPFYSDSGCTALMAPNSYLQANFKENVAQPAATILSENSIVLDLFPPAVGGGVWVKLADDTGNQGTGNVYLKGYFD